MVISVEYLQTCFLSPFKILNNAVNVTWIFVLHRDVRIVLLGVLWCGVGTDLRSLALAVAGEVLTGTSCGLFRMH